MTMANGKRNLSSCLSSLASSLSAICAMTLCR